MDFHRTWFIVGYLTLLLFFGGLAIYSFAQISHGITLLPKELPSDDVLVQEPDRTGETEGETSSLPENVRKPIRMLFAGDVMLSRYVDTLIQRAGSPNMPWELMVETTSAADIFFVNLEAPFSDAGPYDDENLIFSVRPEYVSGLTYAGVDVVSFANNHFRDAGQQGVQRTKDVLVKNNIAYALPGEPALVEQGGWKIGITADAYNLGLNQKTLAADIAALRVRGADFIVSSMHAGSEYVRTPGEAQQIYAHAAIDAGANLVVGHHPHVSQTTEEYGGGYIVYSLGNFIFDQFWSEETRRGWVLTVTLAADGTPTYHVDDIGINTEAQPSIIETGPE